MNNPITKSSLSEAYSHLIEIFQKHPYCRLEGLKVRAGEPQFSPPPRIIQKLRMGADNGPRPELTLPDFWLKRQTIELIETIADLGEGEIRSIDVQHGLPIMVEIERRPVFDVKGGQP